MNKKMRVLLVGGFGYIGSRFIEKFQNKYELIVFSKNQLIQFSPFKKNKVFFGSVSSNDVIECIIKTKPDIVIHLASITGLRKCEDNPDEAFNVNVNGTANVIKGCIKVGSKLIFMSSREVYGITKNIKSNEDDRLEPINIYGQTKVKAEKLIIDASIKNNLDYTILRLTNVYGPSTTYGVNKIISDAVKGKKVQIFGGERIFNLIYIDDVVQAIKLVLENNQSTGKIYNVGSQVEITLNHLVEQLEIILKKKISIERFPPKDFESTYFRPNFKRIENDIGFTAEMDLENGLKKAIMNF